MIFGKKKKKKDAVIPVKVPDSSSAAESGEDRKKAPDQGAPRKKMFPMDSPILLLAQTAGLRPIVTESDIFEGDETPSCFGDYEKIVEDHLEASRSARDNGTSVDGRLEMWVSQDKLKAWAVVFPALFDGAPVTDEQIAEQLAKRKVTSGIDEEARKRLLDPQEALRIITIAEGKPAQNGKDGQVISLIEELDSRFKSDAKGKIDFATWDWILNVDAGQHLCEIIQPTEGVNGVDVTGREIRAKNGRPVPKINGKNTSFTEDGRYLRADGAGQLIQAGGKYTVNEILTIKGDVDYSTGNIKSHSTVIIEGGIKPNFVVESKQDVIVRGSVEWATIIAGHDIIVTGGVTAGPDDYLQAGNDIRCRFMENGRAFCKGSAYFENLVLSQVHAEGSVFVTSGRGSIIAGSVTAMAEISANTIGNRSYRATEVRIGQTPRFTERLERCSADLEATKEAIQTAQNNISRLVKVKHDPKAKAALESQRGLVGMSQIKLENLERRYAELEEKARGVARGRISVDTAHPNVTITIGNESMVLQHEARYAVFVLRDHEIEMFSQ